MKTVEKLALARKQVATWERRREEAIRTLVKAEDKLPGLRRTMKRLADRALAAEQPRAAPKLEPKPTLSESCDYVASALIQGKTFDQAADDLAIPGFLKRAPANTEAAAKIKAEIEEARKAKATARALKVKGQVAERKTHDAIPRSKRRWDTSQSRWIEA